MRWPELGSIFGLRTFVRSFLHQGWNTSASTTDLFSQVHLPLIRFKNNQSEMWEAQLGSHTVRSHGAKVARTHMHDWLILVLLGFIVVILNLIHPFQRFVGEDMLSELKYPMKINTVPFWAVQTYSVMLPIVVFLLFYLRQRDVYDLHHAVLGVLFSVVVTAVITDAIKVAVGRPRPDFFWRCFPDGKDAYDERGNVMCHGEEDVIRQGHKSFPSGHTSWSFAGMGFLSLYLSAKILVFDRRGHIAKLCVVLIPLLAASLVGVSRVDDYKHHWQDVFAGGLLGWKTHTYMCLLEELRAGANTPDQRTCEVEIEIQPNVKSSDLSSGSSSCRGNVPVDDQDVESGNK